MRFSPLFTEIASFGSIMSLTLGGMTDYHPRPYTIDVHPHVIHKIRAKAPAFEPTLDIAAPAWFDGPPTVNVSAAATYFAHEYDWFAYQHQINANFSHYLTTIPGPIGSYPHNIDLHFIHEKSKKKSAIPIILLHGWPSTSLEYSKVIRGLANPADPSKPAFHVVAIDLPGYGFSPAPTSLGLGAPELATVAATLMKQLGYQSYVVYSTDLGFSVALEMLDAYAENISMHVSDFYVSPPNANDLERYANNQTTAEESGYIRSLSAFRDTFSAYAQVHSTFPLSVAHALNDSPVGFLAWMWQVDHWVRDTASAPFTLHDLVSQVMLTYLPGVYGNIRTYKELFEVPFEPRNVSKVPTAVTQWGYPKPAFEILVDFNYAPRDWLNRAANVTFFKRFGEGGHFPAFTQPSLWLETMQEIFADHAGN